MKLTKIVILIISFTFFYSGSVLALRCKDSSDLIHRGDTLIDLINCLGDPLYKETRIIKSKGRSRSYVYVKVESWFYSIDGWSYRIDIANGKILEIENLGRE